MEALQKQLADGLARVDQELRDLRSRGDRHKTAGALAAAAAAAAEAAQQHVRPLV